MSQLSDYLLGRIENTLGQQAQSLRSIESEQSETNDKLETLTEKLDEALTWAQRLIVLGIALLSAVTLNAFPDELGKALAAILSKAVK